MLLVMESNFDDIGDPISRVLLTLEAYACSVERGQR